MKYILHIDGDAFFASCEVSRRPDLKGKPVVVGEERGIASAFTYEAKKLGVYRGMPIFMVRKEFPNIAIISSHFELYEEYHSNLVSILKKYLPLVESYSIDECFTTLPEMPEENILDFIRKIKSEVQNSLGITFSFGVASTKTLAKIASKKEKPDGCVLLIKKEDINKCLNKTQVGAVWGIGRETSASLLAKNIFTAEDFVKTPIQNIEKWFSQPVVETWHELSGKKIFEVNTEHADKKSIQSTRSFSNKNSNEDFLFSELSRNVEVACEELRRSHLFTNKVSMFYKVVVGTNKKRVSADTVLPVYTDDPKIVLGQLKRLSKMLYKKSLMYKGTGVSFLNLRREEFIQDDLFRTQSRHKEERMHLKAVDALNHKFGDWSVMHASSLKSVIKRREEFFLREKKDSYEYGLPLPFMGEVY